MDKVDEFNFLLYAAKHYDNPQCYDTVEFYDDLKRIKYIKRLINRYIEEGDLKERLILNHIIILNNVFGPLGSWNNGKEKAPAALCRKVAMCEPGGTVEVWGPGVQTRSFLFIDECVEGIHKIMASDYTEPLNLGSERMISINNLVWLIGKIADKTLSIKNVPGPQGVMGRNSHNKLIKETIGWAPPDNLEHGLKQTYNWIQGKINEQS